MGVRHEHVARTLVEVVAVVVATVAGVWVVTGTGGSANAADKVWVCKYVGTPGVDERLKEGKNPIEVSISAAGPVGSQFADAQGRSYVIALSNGEPAGPSCPDTPPGPEPSPTCEPTETPPTTGPEETPTESPGETPTETAGTPTAPSPSETDCPDCPTPTPSESVTEGGGGIEAPTETAEGTPGETPSETAEGSAEATATSTGCPVVAGGAGSAGGTDQSGGTTERGGTGTAAPQPSPPTPTEVDAGLAVAAHGSTIAAAGSLRIPALRVTAPLATVTSADRDLRPPSDPAAVGWWSAGAPIGAARGHAVVVGHNVRTGYAAFGALDTLRSGDRVVVRQHGRTLRYRVVSVGELDRDRFAARAPALFSTTADPALVLVTCGDWDGTAYRTNLVVVAAPVV